MFVNQVLSQLYRDHIPFSFGFCGAASDFGSEDHVVPIARLRTRENQVSSHYDSVLVVLLSP